MGTHFSVYVRTQPKGKGKNMGGLCSGLRNCHALHMSAKSRVQWFFYSPEDHVSPSPHTACCTVQRCNTGHTHTINIYMQNKEKVNNERDQFFISCKPRNVDMPWKDLPEQVRLLNLILYCVFCHLLSWMWMISPQLLSWEQNKGKQM